MKNLCSYSILLTPWPITGHEQLRIIFHILGKHFYVLVCQSLNDFWNLNVNVLEINSVLLLLLLLLTLFISSLFFWRASHNNVNVVPITGHQWTECRSPPCMLMTEPPYPAAPSRAGALLSICSSACSICYHLSITSLLHHILFVFTPIQSSHVPFASIRVCFIVVHLTKFH